MIKQLAAAAGVVLILAACGNTEDPEKTKNDDVNSGETAASPEKTYQQNCASCHGNELQGGTGPKLSQVGSELTKEEILKQIENGGDGMPARIIQGEDAEDIAAWLAKKK